MPRSTFSTEEFGHPALEVVHSSEDLDSVRALQFGEKWAAPTDMVHRELDILARDGIDELVILRQTFALVRGGADCRTNSGQQCSEVQAGGCYA